MASTAVSQLIFFIAGLVVASVVVGVMLSSTTNLADGIEGRSSSLADSLRSDVRIINDPVAMPYNATNQTLTLYVLNSGTISLPATNATLRAFVNGTFAANTTVYIVGGGSWGPQGIAIIEVHGLALTSGTDMLVTVVAAHGATDRLEFVAP